MFVTARSRGITCWEVPPLRCLKTEEKTDPAERREGRDLVGGRPQRSAHGAFHAAQPTRAYCGGGILDLPTAHTSKPILRASAWLTTSRPSKRKAGFCIAS